MGYKDKKLLYHMTDIRNSGSILDNGLKPRAEVGQFLDVGDPGIVCLAPGVVPSRKFFSFFVKDEAVKDAVQQLLSARSLCRYVNICPAMFVGSANEL